MSITVPTALVVAVLAIVVTLIVVLWVLAFMLRRQNDEDDLDDDARADSVIAALAQAERDISHRPRVKRAAGLPAVERQP